MLHVFLVFWLPLNRAELILVSCVKFQKKNQTIVWPVELLLRKFH